MHSLATTLGLSMGNTMLTRSRHMHEKKPNYNPLNKASGGLVAATVASKFGATVLSFPQ